MTISNKIDGLNILLIFASLFLSIILPFELFLFSYAVLGPLHYLTEINWLHNKNYFVKEKKYIWILLFFTVIITVLSFFRYLKIEFFFSHYLNYFSKLIINVLIVSSFFFSIGLILFKKIKLIFWSLIISFLLGLIFLKFIPFSFVIIGVFLPTLIHVYLFTLLFMVFGTLNSRSIYGIIAILALSLVPFFIFFNPFLYPYQISGSIKTAFLESKFKNLILTINQLMNDIPISDFDFKSIFVLKIQTFIAFAYTYHYLNWFSKTSIIGWNKNLSKTYLILIIILWLASIALYAYSYQIGISTLFFLSMLHVIIEFPLNIISIKEVFFKIKSFY